MTKIDTNWINNNLQQDKNFHFFEQIDSTQTALKVQADYLPDQTVFIAEKQTAGYGRKNRSWASYAGESLSFSLLLKPTKQLENIQLLPLIMGAALIKATEKIIPCQLKWPNDLVFQGKKIAGILSESITGNSKTPQIIIGVGINGNMPLSHIPKDIQKKATSLQIASGKNINENLLLMNIFHYFDLFYQEYLATGKAKTAIQISRENSAVLGKDIRVITDQATKSAQATKIDEQGFLWVQFENSNKPEPLINQEISIRGMTGYI